jgi:hypothetical protein
VQYIFPYLTKLSLNLPESSEFYAHVFRSLPLLVKGMPIDLDIRALAEEMPVNRFHEKPPRFI